MMLAQARDEGSVVRDQWPVVSGAAASESGFSLDANLIGNWQYSAAVMADR